MPKVTTTAKWAAAQRACESRRPDRLFFDPFASALAGEEGRTALELSERVNPRGEETAAYIAIRVRFLDDLVLRLAREGIRQIVLPAAGMDARAFRLDLAPETVVYEIDHPELLEEKENILRRAGARPKCRRVTLPANLYADWAKRLEQAGFCSTEPSIWILEGLLYYLSEQEVSRLLAEISELSAKDSGFGADVVSRSTLTSPWMQRALKQMEQSGFGWKFGSDDPEGLFAPYGWMVETRQLGEDGANFGRWDAPVEPRTRTEIPRTFLVEGRKNLSQKNSRRE